MTIVLIAVGVVSVAYGAAMGVLYPARGFFLAWIVVGAALLAAGWAHRTGAWQVLPVWIRRIAVAVMALVACGVFAGCALIVCAAASTPPANLDYIVVLGANLNADGSPKETLRYRLDEAAAYLERNPETTCVVSGGQGPDEPCSEAESMARYLEAAGVNASRVILEDRSTTTAENLRFSAALLDSPDASVGVVTNDFHVLRATRIARRQGLTSVYGISAPTNPLYLPQACVRECVALAKDAMVGNL
mgnify:CR=1 FL=1